MHRVIVITGASAGIGRAAARAFAMQEDKIALIARGKAGLDEAAREVEQLGGEALPIVGDVSDATQMDAAADATEHAFGSIDIWVNNAMVTVFSPFLSITPDEFRRVTEVTYLGTVYGTMAALKRMAPRGRGHIIQVGSALSYRAIPLQSAYCGAKFAIRGFTDSLRSELIHDGIGVHLTMIQLPAHNTPQFTWGRTHVAHSPQPVPPIFQPEVAARAIVWTADHPRREVRVGWPALKAIWSNKLFPAYADRRLAATGYDGQMTAEHIDPDRPDNLFEPLDAMRDFGAHGRFDNRAQSRSTAWQIASHKRGLSTTAIALGAAGMLWRSRKQRARTA